MANTTDWLSISSSSGSSGETSLTLTARRNTSTDYKTATVTAYNPVHNISATTYVTIESYAPYLTISPALFGVPASGGTYALSISADCAWVIAFPDLVSTYSTSAGTGDASVTFTVPSTVCASTLVGNIVVTDETGQVSRTSRIEQYGGGAHIYYAPSAFTLPYYGGSEVFNVTADCAYSIVKGSGQWYSVTPQTGYTGTTQFTISSNTINEGDTDWTDNILIVGPEGTAGFISLTQLNYGQYHIAYTADTSTIDYSGETRTITIDATDFINSSITVTILDAPDVTYTYETSGLTKGIITLTIPQCPGDQRTFTVVVSGRRAMSQNYATAAIQYTQEALELNFVTDTSNVAGTGETRTITILNTDIVSNRTGLNLPSDFPSPGSYTVSGNTIYLTYPSNPSSSATRTWTIGVVAQTTGGVSLSGYYTITQDANVIYPIPYTADTSMVNATGETRVITIDNSSLVDSSITVSVEGATGVTTSYSNGVIVVVFPSNSGQSREIGIYISGETAGGDTAQITVPFVQGSLSPAGEFLTFSIRNDSPNSNGTVVFSITSNSSFTRTIEYRKNKSNWVSATATRTQSIRIPVNKGDIVEFKGNNSTYTGYLDDTYSPPFGAMCHFIVDSVLFDISGNLMSLVDSQRFEILTALTGEYNFGQMFRYAETLRNTSGLTIGTEDLHLTKGCFYQTFAAIDIVSLPSLPSMHLAEECYHLMFAGCDSITGIPANYLPATTLADYCYMSMFSDCRSLVTIPNGFMAATSVGRQSCSQMFGNCTGLTTAPSTLPATTLAQSCYMYMFSNCTSLTTAPSLPATTLANSCYYQMFYNCMSLTTAPSLPATALTMGCYQGMFGGCAGLTTAPSLPATTLASNCYYRMFYYCTSLTTAPELPATTLASYCYYQMFYGCTSLNYIKCLATNISASYSRTDWVKDVSPTGLFVKNPNMANWPRGDDGIPTGWVTYDPYLDVPLTFKITSGGTIYWKASHSAFTTTIQYSTNSGSTWTSITSSTEGTSISVSAGDTVQFRGDNAAYGTNSGRRNTFSGSTAKFEVEGNIMSLIDSTGYATATTLASSSTFYNLFGNCTGLTSAENLVLPATGLTEYCYQVMFQGCTSLTTAPELPATILGRACYNGMFYGCTSLTTAPALPATTLAISCYGAMFANCTSLTTAPSLPVTALTNYCYQAMFAGCTGLTTAPSLPATTLAEYCYGSMFSGCTGLTTAPSLAATTLANNCYQQMFSNCMSLTTAPALPATTLTNNCYYAMFKGCTGLTTAPSLSATTLADSCYYQMFNGCTFLTTAPALNATTLASNCYYGMFQDCTSLTTAPALPAATLASSCYTNMFKDCSSLNYIKCLATNTAATQCTTDWVSGVSATGTFVKDSNMSSWTVGNNGIPTGWVTENVSPYAKVPLTFNIISGGTIVWKAQDGRSAYTRTIEYSLDSGATWTSITSTITGTSFNVSAGDKVMFRGDNRAYSDSNHYHNTFIGTTAVFEVEGNIMSLINSSAYMTLTTLSNAFTFDNLFRGCTGLTSVENLLLPATTLANYCYQYMFSGCTSLTTAPWYIGESLTTMSEGACRYMFYGCTSLRKGPELPAPTLAKECYQYMFNGCTALTTAPSSIGTATTIAYSGCCQAMFSNCTSLTTAPELPASAAYTSSYDSMFYGCTSLRQTPALPATSLGQYCYKQMFYGCTSLDAAVSILPAASLQSHCYRSMFEGCTSLTMAPELPAESLNYYSYYHMFYNCTSLNYIKCLAKSISADNCRTDWVKGVSSTGLFVKNPNMSPGQYWPTNSTSGIPSGWTVQDAT